MTADLTLSQARADRDRLADRTDVLDKVGVLATLPDDMNVMTSAVAEFYGVPVETVRTTVNRNRDEFDADGYTIVSRGEFEGSFNMKLPSSASTVALFPRRAVLRLGMLLRDSEVARRVRDYLLTVEDVARSSEDQIIEQALRILQGRNAELVAENAELTAEVAELKPKAEVAAKLLDAEGDLSVKDAAQSLTRAGIKTGQNRLFQTLETRYRWVSRGHDGRYRVKQPAIEGGWMSVLPQSHYHPRTGQLVLDPPQPRVTPKGLQRILADSRGDGAI